MKGLLEAVRRAASKPVSCAEGAAPSIHELFRVGSLCELDVGGVDGIYLDGPDTMEGK